MYSIFIHERKCICRHTAFYLRAFGLVRLCVPDTLRDTVPYRKGATGASGVFFVFCTVMFAAIILILWFVLLIVEVACAVKSLKNEPVEVPFITNWVLKVAEKVA